MHACVETLLDSTISWHQAPFTAPSPRLAFIPITRSLPIPATRHIVEPRAVFHRDGRWYLTAWNVEKDEEHLFRLDGIASVELGTRVFGEHKGPPLTRYVGRRLFFETGAEREVTIRFRGTAARLQKERYGARARENPDGSVSVTMRVTPGNYLMGVVLGYGGEATVEAPEDVADALRKRVAQLAEIYEAGTRSSARPPRPPSPFR